MADLPGTDLCQLPAGGNPLLPQRRAPGPVQAPGNGSSPAWSAAWRFWLAISVGALVIWLLSGASGGLWLLLIALPLGLVMLRRGILGGSRYDHRSRGRG